MAMDSDELMELEEAPAMPNSTQLVTTTTLANVKLNEIIRVIFLLPTSILYIIFLYFMVAILKVFFSFPRLQENSRYVLFIHILNTCTFRVTPYNLAVMSLERYAAICYPLRHAEVCSVQRSKVAVFIMWTVGLFPQFVSFLIFSFLANEKAFSASTICHWPLLTIHEAQNTVRTIADVTSFTGVWLIIAYTYIRVMLVARRAGSGKLASKAGKTVLLHAFQLLLCMLSFTTTLTEQYLRQYFYYLPLTNFVILVCLPRLVSPFIYGIRDEIFGKHMTKMCRSAKTSSL
ncbi:odorant receptor 131-2-like [Hyperolius riggenbachi]|uniref:odorant receptor 131-2-like n=1 Tax=Hyperolius riggenbachi TaxID=752182 RepID=UPI0035A28E2A